MFVLSSLGWCHLVHERQVPELLLKFSPAGNSHKHSRVDEGRWCEPGSYSMASAGLEPQAPECWGGDWMPAALCHLIMYSGSAWPKQCYVSPRIFLGAKQPHSPKSVYVSNLPLNLKCCSVWQFSKRPLSANPKFIDMPKFIFADVYVSTEFIFSVNHFIFCEFFSHP